MMRIAEFCANFVIQLKHQILHSMKFLVSTKKEKTHVEKTPGLPGTV